ncbi:hypothetical protein NORO109296_22415 [Nocardiopsis rhodophaea]
MRPDPAPRRRTGSRPGRFRRERSARTSAPGPRRRSRRDRPRRVARTPRRTGATSSRRPVPPRTRGRPPTWCRGVRGRAHRVMPRRAPGVRRGTAWLRPTRLDHRRFFRGRHRADPPSHRPEPASGRSAARLRAQPAHSHRADSVVPAEPPAPPFPEGREDRGSPVAKEAPGRPEALACREDRATPLDPAAPRGPAVRSAPVALEGRGTGGPAGPGAPAPAARR